MGVSQMIRITQPLAGIFGRVPLRSNAGAGAAADRILRRGPCPTLLFVETDCKRSLPRPSWAPGSKQALGQQRSAHAILQMRLWRIPVAMPSIAGASADAASIDAWLLAVLEDEELRQQVRQLKKVELANVWQLTRTSLLLRHCREAPLSDPLDVHRRLIAGLAGEALLVSSSMFLDTLSDAEGFFDLSFKTIKSRLGSVLDTAASERAMRGARATLTAAEVLGGFEAARAYMHTPNYALGGHTPAELIKTSEGERIVLNELQAQAEGGPL